MRRRVGDWLRVLLGVSLGSVAPVAAQTAPQTQASAAPQTEAVDPHEAQAHRENEPGTLVLVRRRVLELAAARGPEVLVARAPRPAVVEAQRLANPLFVQPAQASIYGGFRWGNIGAGPEITANVVQPLGLRDLGGARARSSHALAELGMRDVEAARLQSAERALLAWVDVLEAKAVHDLRAESRDEADAVSKLASSRVAAGVGEPLEMALAEGERGAADVLELDAEGRLTVALLALRHALGLPTESAIDADGDLLTWPALDEERGPAIASHTHPLSRRARAEASLAHAEAQVARASVAPSLGLGLGYQREGTADQVVLGGLVLPLPFGDHGGYALARQRAEALRLDARSAMLARELERDRAILAHEREHTRTTYEALVRGARTPLTEALRLARARYAAGPGDLATVLLARQRLLAAEERVVSAAAEVQRADIRHAAIVGSLLAEER